MTDTELPFEVAGAVRVAGRLHFHPRKFLLSLAQKVVAAGGRIYERTRVTELHLRRPAGTSAVPRCCRPGPAHRGRPQCPGRRSARQDRPAP
ncbi:FAD-dependent oxidoreductase [Streptomyces sp. NPDC056352]|uniref:FAD-dependent oxidoreductase n=1 Tax=Streptomyces sp. NPDC056352 TaxID=3345791 RepID=UPI0035DC168E